MAIKYHTFWGATQQSFEDVGAGLIGSDWTISTSVKPHSSLDGSYAITSQGSSLYNLEFWSGNGTGSGQYGAVGFWYRKTAHVGGIAVTLIRVADTADTGNFFLSTLSTDIYISNPFGGNYYTINYSFGLNTWYFIEVLFPHHNAAVTGEYRVFVNGSEKTYTKDGTYNSNRTSAWIDKVQLHAHGSGTNYYGPGYLASGLTSFDAGPPIGSRHNQGCRVYGFRSGITSATPDSGDALDEGTWDLAEAVPTDSTSGAASYTNSIAQAGYILCDGEGGSATTGGLAADTNITDVKAARVSARINRGGGGSTATHLAIGKSLTNMASSADLALTTTVTEYNLVVDYSDAACPAVGDDLWIGIEKDAGGQDMDVWSIGGSILDIPVSGLDAMNEVTKSNISAINEVSLANITYINDMNTS